MKRSSLRSFGIACFIIGMVMVIANQFNLPFLSSKDSSNEEQYKDQITQLEHQLEEAKEQITLLEQKEQTAPQKIETTDDKTKSEEEVPEEVISGTLYIYSGLTVAEVAQKLKEMGIIHNSVELELFLAQPEYAKSIQKGQFELNSSMSIEEIANIITGKPSS
ncbi:endolytic transglycosylase MltG [Ureibacillus sp. Re31]|uniref:Endolytic transglycosylase MltG n=1 Tax=Ureibacillus galli TaxID=2762222 RepID=A0ABR8XAD3_9BACL|nr:endolytic transglycosylase MltG [Ureibacillus galli]MBD8026067.1 endolytic transglycosylase MltG [Ureibacillus galli]